MVGTKFELFCVTLRFTPDSMRINLFFIIILLLAFAGNVSGQNPIELAAKAELSKRGIAEDDFVAEMNRRGIDIYSVDVNDRASVAIVEKEVKEAIELLSNEKSNGKALSQNLTPNIDVEKREAEIGTATKEAKKIDGVQQDLIEKVEKPEENKPVNIYGHQFFIDKSLSLYDASSKITPPRNYILGPGDVVSVSIWGVAEANFALEIEKDGYIKPSELPRFYLAGLNIDEAEQVIFNGVRRRYPVSRENFQMSVVSPRNINISIFGEVKKSGSFNLSALNSAFNALVATGGLTDIASVRQIKLIRANEIPRIIDVYRLINKPEAAFEFYLKNNDIIHVPVAGRTVRLTGAVNRTGRFELIEGEELKEVLAFAGGLKFDAVKNNILVRRLVNGREQLFSVNLDELDRNNINYSLNDGDVISINSSSLDYENAINISGAVEIQGEYAWRENMRLSELLSLSKPLENAILDSAYIKRLNPDKKTVIYRVIDLKAAIESPGSEADILLERGDRIIVRALSDFVDSRRIIVSGSVRNPGEFTLDDSSLRVADAVFLSGGLEENAAAFAYLFRQVEKNKNTKEYIFVDLNTAMSNRQSAANLFMMPGDSLHVYASEYYTEMATVRIAGAVRNPGEYVHNPSLTLRDVLLMAGGLRREAASNRIDLYRLIIDAQNKTQTLAQKISLSDTDAYSDADQIQLEPFDQIYVRFAPEFEFQRTVQLNGELVFSGTYALTSQNTRISDVLKQAGGITAEADIDAASFYRNFDNVGMVMVDIKEALRRPGSYHDIVLLEGDEIFIPKSNEIVSIVGATRISDFLDTELLNNGKLNIAYKKDKSAAYYINNFAGGFHSDADRSAVFVRTTGGKIERTKKIFLFRSYPKVPKGGVITIPYKKKSLERMQGLDGKEEESINWGEVLANALTQATAVLTLILLLQRLD
jgi:protein involved in polysaccharide export with SLBB domain